MQEHKIEKLLKGIFEDVGVYLEEEFYDIPLNLDSLQFVEVIINIEETFMIRLSNDFSNFDNLVTYRDFYNLIDFYSS